MSCCDYPSSVHGSHKCELHRWQTPALASLTSLASRFSRLSLAFESPGIPILLCDRVWPRTLNSMTSLLGGLFLLLGNLSESVAPRNSNTCLRCNLHVFPCLFHLTFPSGFAAMGTLNWGLHFGVWLLRLLRSLPLGREAAHPPIHF